MDTMPRKYESLTTDDRFRLIMAAAYQQDTREIRRLTLTNRPTEITMRDAGMHQRIRAAEALANNFLILWLDKKKRLNMEIAEWFVWLGDHRANFLEDVLAGKELDFTPEDVERQRRLRKALQEVEDGKILFEDVDMQAIDPRFRPFPREDRSLITGFYQFCREANLTPEHVLVYAPLYRHYQKRIEAELSECTPEDPPSEWVDFFRHVWRLKVDPEGA